MAAPNSSVSFARKTPRELPEVSRLVAHDEAPAGFAGVGFDPPATLRHRWERLEARAGVRKPPL